MAKADKKSRAASETPDAAPAEPGKASGKKTSEGKTAADTLPPELEPSVDAAPVDTHFGSFDLDDPVLPEWVEQAAFKSGGYPYDTPLKASKYEADLTGLQIELVKLQHHVIANGLKLVLLFEGRDAAGKGGAIFAFRQFLNPRTVRDVALPKPTDAEQGQWYFQRYVAELPTAGEIVTFDRSWYNRAGVEAVMGFCTPEETERFLEDAPRFERLLVRSGIVLFKFWLDIGREMQLKRFHERRHNPLKIWKLSPMDYAALHKWDAYSKARDNMIAASHADETPWTVVLANDKRRARLNLIRHVLLKVDYAGRDMDVIGKPDPLVLGHGSKFLKKK